MWQTIEGLQDPDLKRLATCLPDTILQGRADSTTCKYVRAFTKWRTWAGQKKEVKTFPVDEVHGLPFIYSMWLSPPSLDQLSRRL